MTSKLLICFALCAPAFGGLRIASVSGNWASPATWGGNSVPGNGDTVSVNNDVTVTVSDERIAGTSGPNGTIDLMLNASGRIVVARGGILHVRGNSTTASANPLFFQVEVQGGGVWEFDASRAAFPATTHYTYGPSGYWDPSSFKASGTATSHAVVRSNAGGGSGQFSNNGTNSGINFEAAYTDFVLIGDASHFGWLIRFVSWTESNHSVRWNVTNSTFSSCGAIASGNVPGVYGAYGVDPGGTFIHDFNVHNSTQGGQIFSYWDTDNNAVGSGVREIKGNVFDSSLCRDFFYPGGFTITGNYFGDGAALNGFSSWASWTNNFVRLTDYWAVCCGAGGMGVMGDLHDTYVFVDSDWGNPKPLVATAYIPVASIYGLIYGQAGTALGPPGPGDSGELWFTNANPASSAVPYGVYNSIILPNMAGYASLEIGAPTIAAPNQRAIAEHNTWFGGWERSPCTNAAICFGALDVGESGNGLPGVVASFRANILWNPQLPSYQTGFFKLVDVGVSANPVQDYCAPSKCDYNTGWGHSLSDPAHSQYTNQGKGYAARFSSTPGVHDVDVNPMFVDYRRSVELYDSRGLNYRPAAWNAAATYGVASGLVSGTNYVQSSDPAVYWGLPVNYRYQNTGACNAANPKPGVGAKWRDCWEWATLYRMRTDIAATAGKSNFIANLMAWVRKGYAPTNPALNMTYPGDTNAVHNIGAVATAPAGGVVFSSAP